MAQERSNPYPFPYHWSLSPFYNQIYEYPVALLRNLLPPDTVVVDIGCGDGRRAVLLASFVRRVCGVESQSRPLQFARLLVQATNVDFVRQDVGAGLPFRSESIDVVTAFEFIEHVPRDVARTILCEARRVLRNRGRLVLTTPNRRSLRNRVWGHRLNPKHYFELSLEEGRAILEEAGFHMLSASGVYVPIPLPGIEHYASVFPFRSLFSSLIRLGPRWPSLAETLFLVGEKAVMSQT